MTIARRKRQVDGSLAKSLLANFDLLQKWAVSNFHQNLRDKLYHLNYIIIILLQVFLFQYECVKLMALVMS